MTMEGGIVTNAQEKEQVSGEPMDAFTQREKAFEEKYIHDEELYFRLIARRNRLFGLWVAGFLGYYGEKAERYVEGVILTDVQKTHQEDVLHKVLKDLKKAKIEMSEHRLQKQLDSCWEVARKMIMNEEKF